MLQAILAKTIIKQVMKAIEKADDKKIARTLHERIKKLEKLTHAPRDFVTCDCCKKKLKQKK